MREKDLISFSDFDLYIPI